MLCLWLLLALSPPDGAPIPGAEGAPETPTEPPTEPPAEQPSTRRRIGVLPLEIDGNVPNDARSRLQQRVHLALDDEAIETFDLAGRDDPAAANADVMIAAYVMIQGRDYVIQVELLRPDGSLIQRADATCEICTHAEAAESLGFEVAAMRTRVDDKTAPTEVVVTKPTLRVSSRPSGANVALDGKVVGRTPYEGTIAPGPHEIELRHAGHRPEQSKIEAVAGGTNSVSVTLRERKARPLLVGGWTAVGVSIPLLASGITLIALDERPYQRDCSGSDVDQFGNCRFRYATLEGGIAATVVGVLAAGTGIALLVLDARRRKKSVEVSITPPSGILLRGRF